MIYKKIYKEHKLERAHELQGISQEPVKRGLEEKKLWTLIHYATAAQFWSTESPPRF